MLNGHAEEYSKLVLGRSTGCSPTTPIPLPYIENKVRGLLNKNPQRLKTCIYLPGGVDYRDQSYCVYH